MSSFGEDVRERAMTCVHFGQPRIRTPDGAGSHCLAAQNSSKLIVELFGCAVQG